MAQKPVETLWNFGIPLLSAVALYALDVSVKHYVGFMSAAAAPYAVVAIVIAAEMGTASAMTFLGAAVLLVAAVTPAISGWSSVLALPLHLRGIRLETRIGVVLMAVTVAWVLLRLKRYRQNLSLVRSANRSLKEQRDQARSEADGLELSIRELYRRTATESAGVTVLYHQIQRMYSYDQSQTFSAVLDALHQLTGATSAIIYRFDESGLNLTPIAGWPEGAEKDQEVLESSETVEGWVLRNNQLFSVRMLLTNDDLRRIDRKQTVLAVPIHAFGRIWGVLSVQDMPFERYNEFAELAVQLVVALASPAVEQSLFKVSAGHGTARDQAQLVANARPGTAQPVGSTAQKAEQLIEPFTEFAPAFSAAIREAAEAGRNVSLFVFEIREGEDLVRQFGMEAMRELIAEMGRSLQTVSKGTAQVFEYDRSYQLAALVSAIEYDAAGYMLLRVLESFSSRAWSVAGEAILPEIIVGFSSTNQTMFQSDEMMRRVEAMLAGQRTV